MTTPRIAVDRGKNGSPSSIYGYNTPVRPYQPEDKIKPVFFGDRCDDPLAGGDTTHEASPREVEMSKSKPPDVPFLTKP